MTVHKEIDHQVVATKSNRNVEKRTTKTDPDDDESFDDEFFIKSLAHLQIQLMRQFMEKSKLYHKC